MVKVLRRVPCTRENLRAPRAGSSSTTSVFSRYLQFWPQTCRFPGSAYGLDFFHQIKQIPSSLLEEAFSPLFHELAVLYLLAQHVQARLTFDDLFQIERHRHWRALKTRMSLYGSSKRCAKIRLNVRTSSGSYLYSSPTSLTVAALCTRGWAILLNCSIWAKCTAL